ncbi:hypothetical protein Syn6312_1487 [Synechococcus sp. PCC 6312]|nr:hypothetical protein Syn6312_1487 [Synechococcus sp. PCC 6312]
MDMKKEMYYLLLGLLIKDDEVAKLSLCQY